VGGIKRELHLVTTQGRTAGHQLWVYQSTSKMATESVLGTWVKQLSWNGCLHKNISLRFFSFYFCAIYVFLLQSAKIFAIYIYIDILFPIHLSHMFSNHADADTCMYM